MFSLFHTKKYHEGSSRGFSLVEIILTLGILAIVSAIVLSSFSNGTDTEALLRNTEAVAAVFAEARSLTTSAKNASNYGVHLASTGPTLFKGTSYSSGIPSNIPLLVNSRVSITDISLTGGGSDVVFDKLTGNTSQNGSFRVTLVSNSSKYKTITVYKTGLVEIQ
ncbi:prepilin-type N-terminal cleavage/methylation domain-containing protein [Patescibacteria group bacterium]|nr:MAG: prepilin-type N-terminal cleavage/methylation domain-containing protein [Patescibacteria group bacterium]